MKSIILLIMVATNVSFAGVFSSGPPKEFLNLPVTCAYCGGNWFTLDNLLKHGFSPQAKQSWEKIDDSQWLLKIVVDDKVSGNRTKFNILFVKTEGVANVLRININGEDAGSAVFPNMLAPMRDSVWAKVGAPREEAKAAKVSTKKATKSNSAASKTAAKPEEPENLSKGLKGTYVQEYAEDANSSAFSIEETSPGSIRLVANAPISCEATLNLKRNFAGQIYANAADNPGLYFEIANNDGEVKLWAQIRSSCKGPCCDLKKHYLRQ